ncbi:family 1 extracellular solute-binding protein [Fictibacillus macauensis ZFHKF-1]|uniref:Family 1 extracellular solute-binding protein n=1 Tax=Fictibacillus macauensis ZFHKF-1 TaxID=1196324 RepID=I8UFA2_9BACL|nr:spermidine/putrescine ABC transporter substrate-binding protein [Fictibacillus macauensis]EIT85570.1 family 1 extracellular solute-binding protein [Fictibacillus macauensis ZFHKF-1]
MSKLLRFFITIIVLSGILFYIVSQVNTSQGYTSKNTLTIYNWGDYIDPDLIKKFEKKTGVKVIYETFDSNEAMLTKIEQGGTTYDVAIPSEYTIEKMKQEHLLLPIDLSKVPNIKNIDKRFLDLPFDRGNTYSVPYFWGTVGIVYNKKLLGNKNITSWQDLWDKDLRNKIFLVDGVREIMGIGLTTTGYSLNDTNHQHLQKAKRKLDTLIPNVRAIVGDETKLLLANGDASIGIGWSGNAAEIIDENPDLDYVIPKEGSNLWFDNMVIPKTAKNKKAALQFMNFMLDPKVAAQNTEYVHYSSPNKAALKYLPKEISTDKRFYPPKKITDQLEVYRNLSQKDISYFNELFLEFKMHRK